MMRFEEKEQQNSNIQKRFQYKKPFARGAEHLVCLREEDSIEDAEVVGKFKGRHCIWNSASYEDQCSNLEKLNDLDIRYCSTEIFNPGQIIVDSEIIEVPYLIEQSFSRDGTLSEIDLLKPEVREQLLMYLQKSDQMYREENKAIDFLGGESMIGLIKYFFSTTHPLTVYNFKIDPLDEIYLMDTGLLILDKVTPMFKKIIDFMIQLQHYLIYKVINFHGKQSNFIPEVGVLTKTIAFPAYLATRAYFPFKNY